MEWGGEGFEEWSDEFMEELFQKENIATQNPLPTTTTFPPQRHQTSDSSVTYSPPRHLFQWPSSTSDIFHHFSNSLPPPPLPLLHSMDQQIQPFKRPITDMCDHFSNALSPLPPPPVPVVVQVDPKDQEIDRLKRELGLVSRQLTDLEHECAELRNENIKKEEQIKSVYSNKDKIDTVQGLNRANLEHGLPGLDTNVASNIAKSTKSLEEKIVHGTDAGVQTDNDGDYMKLDLEGDQSSQLDLQKKLLGIWSSTSDQSFGRNLISKMFMSCQKDFHQLFGSMSIKMPSKVPANSVASGRSSNATGMDTKHSFQSSEAAKVSYLFTVLTKISNGVLPLESLFESLLDLCNIENVIILQSSLSILHALLRHLLSLGRKLEERNNVKVEGLSTGNNNEDMSRFVVGGGEASHTGWRQFGSRSSDSPSLSKSRYWNVDMALSRVNWIPLFDLMHRIALCNRNECVRLEALSIINLILMRSNAYTERERFGQRVVFESVAEFLKNEAGSHVQKEALYLLYLLLNCPELLSIFCSSCAEISDDVNGKKDASNIKAFSFILEGLADCVSCNGNAVKDIEVRKRALILLAFLASSGKLGFHILVNHKLHGEATFLMLILQVLMSEIDMEASASVETSENVKARISFIREALILLNRLVSNPDYSAVVLRALVANRDLATLTCDIVSRLSRKVYNLMLLDGGSQQIRDTEIVDLARGFRKRIFSYLGENIS